MYFPPSFQLKSLTFFWGHQFDSMAVGWASVTLCAHQVEGELANFQNELRTKTFYLKYLENLEYFGHGELG